MDQAPAQKPQLGIIFNGSLAEESSVMGYELNGSEYVSHQSLIRVQ